jgi:hypothetical protein
MPTCYGLSVDETDFRELNRQLGPFRFVLTDENHSWAISCNEWYNLFGAKPELLEGLLGKPVEQVRQEFQEFASLLAKGKAGRTAPASCQALRSPLVPASSVLRAVQARSPGDSRRLPWSAERRRVTRLSRG